MLQNDLFIITSLSREDSSFKVMLELNAGHKIFEGHFPGKPIVPGACMMQMVKEIAETILGKELRLIRADHLKFIALIDPNEKGILEMGLTYNIKEGNTVSVSASLLKDARVCFKFNGLFQTR